MIFLILFAFLAGIVTILSPCILPLLPIILSSSTDSSGKRKPFGVVVGFVASFTFFTLFLSSIVRISGISADSLRHVSIFILGVFGASLLIPQAQLFVKRLFGKLTKFVPASQNKEGFSGGVLIGLSLGLLWTPCVGPILASVISLALSGAVTSQAVLITLAYSLGTSIPMFMIMQAGSTALQKVPWLVRNTANIQKFFGALMITTAVGIFFNFDRQFQTFILKSFPQYGLGLTKFEDNPLIKKELKKMSQKKKDESEVSEITAGETIVRDVKLQSDFTGAKVNKDDLLSGCSRKDCIPSIDEPKFESALEADKWLEADDLVFALNYQGVVKAYPQRIMNWHEIVNDFAGDEPIAVTFCPLCGSALVFNRTVNGVVTELGVSGKLHQSDLVMYDRYEGNLWQQITGEAIVGPAARRNEKLTRIPMIAVAWEQWQEQHPETQVLSRETGFLRNYSQYPYGTYEENNQLLFGVKNLDKSLHPKAVVYGVEVDGGSKAYPEDAFSQKSKISDSIGDILITLEKQDNGEVVITNLNTTQKIVPIRLFWFAWAAFHPETELY